MPTYDYQCVENGQVVEVKHSINDELTTWGEVCAGAGIDLGATPADSRVERLITGGQVINSSALKNPEPACASGSCCAGGMCGF
ncbi:MAG: zinc ribbon domain-containing protein [Candidatus Parabeggiatoa sp. nov. 2]|nr:MAG: regulator [Beggiatoa sp. 4572_84]RKZ58364.1 MAG: zinc ribbon domain-containing protein [Gammaproteobacteria bacterium]HEC83790.1 zinc ribbon domain-containing protein [Thioploca sp.]